LLAELLALCELNEENKGKFSIRIH
jgi:hypothetical protein